MNSTHPLLPKPQDDRDIESGKDVIVEGPFINPYPVVVPYDYDTHRLSAGTIVGVVLGVLFLLGITGFLARHWYEKKYGKRRHIGPPSSSKPGFLSRALGNGNEQGDVELGTRTGREARDNESVISVPPAYPARR